jgi:hypothetical protein
MSQQAWSIEIEVTRTIGKLPADRCARKRAIVCVLPAHLEWRKMPVVTTWNAGAVGIRFLMTTRTVEARHAEAFPTANDIGDMTVSIIALLWIVGGSVTVYAAR